MAPWEAVESNFRLATCNTFTGINVFYALLGKVTHVINFPPFSKGDNLCDIAASICTKPFVKEALPKTKEFALLQHFFF